MDQLLLDDAVAEALAPDAVLQVAGRGVFDRVGGGRVEGGAYSCIACLGRLAVDHAPRSKRCTVPASTRDIPNMGGGSGGSVLISSTTVVCGYLTGICVFFFPREGV